MPALDALTGSRHRVAAVLTQPDRPSGRGQLLRSSPVKQRALELGLPVHQPATLRTPEAEALLRSLALDALVVVAYGLILPPVVLAAPRLGCLNIHASLLPRWRGAAPIQRALLAGDPVTGISIMRMEAGLDTGPVLLARAIDIAPNETAGSLHDRLSVLGAQLICEALDAVADGRAQAVPQPEAGVTYAEKIRKAEAAIDWNEDAALILRRVRAFNPTPVAETRLSGVQLRIWEAQLGAAPAAPSVPTTAPTEPATAGRAQPGTVLRAGPQGIDVACGQGVLRLLKLQLAGKRPMSAGEFIRSRDLAGARFEGP